MTDDDDVEKIRQQQHTGNHDPAGGADRFGGTRAGAENVEPTAQRDARSSGPTLIVTRDDANEWRREPEAYADALARKLHPYGVTVRLELARTGNGALVGVTDAKLEVDIRHAIAMVNTEGT